MYIFSEIVHSHDVYFMIYLVVKYSVSVQFSSVAKSCLTFCGSLSNTNSQSLPKLMSIESMMPSNHLILCCPFLLPPSILPSIRVFSSESVLCIRWPKDWSFSFSISPTNEYSGLISTRSRALGFQSLPLMGWLVLAPWLQSTVSTIVAHGRSCSRACGIFLDQGLNSCLLHWQMDSYAFDGSTGKEVLGGLF